ncbi:LGFP repeat-containing protein [Gordonia aquimaris]|uniref:Lysozyme n=1 Tax=Gordonia aquimaris TaxID=2984863 RepID=A0A9X3D8M0_9ACTN|nr:lysozyme [Gordonia aquimaris]MCX2966722.1 lysozyme [Gordonia aquimaris]
MPTSDPTPRPLARRALRTTAVVMMTLVFGALGFIQPASADVVLGGHAVGGKIGEAYLGSGGVFKWGVPTSDERAAAKGGRYQTFARDVTFYWHPSADDGTAHQIGGAIRQRWQAAGAERGPVGFPVTNEFKAGSGRANDFTGGSICWSKTGGAQIVWGGILQKWRATGAAGGYYGVPLGGEYRVGSRFAQDFANGTIFWP